MLFARRAPTRTERLVDAVLGVSRRRRRLAMMAIAGGLAALRPLLWRTAFVVVMLISLIGFLALTHA